MFSGDEMNSGLSKDNWWWGGDSSNKGFTFLSKLRENLSPGKYKTSFAIFIIAVLLVLDSEIIREKQSYRHTVSLNPFTHYLMMEVFMLV